MDWYDNVFELIDMRSFSNLWFWIALAVLWSTTSHWVLGVPWDMAMRAHKGKDPKSVADLEDLVRINTNRILYIARESGLLLTGAIFFALTAICLLGFVYHNEFAQALFLMAFPMSIVALVSVSSASAIQRLELSGEALFKRLHRHRVITQAIGVVSIFVTAMWGMLQNMNHSALSW
ncbi:hypothetical protein PEL8287_00242 [Roseovarius litorisediminis]|uniref:Component of SufBCD complex n=1 Tax=Roseovarius litorisediminis TaxID=1312363 RepID=A0A1Y5R829_9RHOB|nr:component of SufBCD complex [Roseovarius litorisediminis]SLN11265.1 hypothetical protein PEL8287_00242 [Roseovarius litorisediminis]